MTIGVRLMTCFGAPAEAGRGVTKPPENVVTVATDTAVGAPRALVDRAKVVGMLVAALGRGVMVGVFVVGAVAIGVLVGLLVVVGVLAVVTIAGGVSVGVFVGLLVTVGAPVLVGADGMVVTVATNVVDGVVDTAGVLVGVVGDDTAGRVGAAGRVGSGGTEIDTGEVALYH